MGLDACTCDLCVIRSRLERERFDLDTDALEAKPGEWMPSEQTLLASALRSYEFRRMVAQKMDEARAIQRRTGQWPTPTIRTGTYELGED